MVVEKLCSFFKRMEEGTADEQCAVCQEKDNRKQSNVMCCCTLMVCITCMGGVAGFALFAGYIFLQMTKA